MEWTLGLALATAGSLGMMVYCERFAGSTPWSSSRPGTEVPGMICGAIAVLCGIGTLAAGVAWAMPSVG